MGYDKSVFARNLVYYMKKNGESQINIAKYLNVSKSTVSAYCSGKQIPRIDKIELLAIHFGIEKSDLIEQNQPSETEGLSDLAIQIAKLVDRLPPESRQLLLVQVRALAQAVPDPDGPAGSS